MEYVIVPEMAYPDLNLLACFETVARAKSMSAAAGVLQISQPAVSKKIQKLETFLRTALIVRSVRPLKLTKAGEGLLVLIPPVLAEARKLMQGMEGQRQIKRATLRLGMPDSLAETMGAEIVGVLKNLAAQIELKTGISPWLETAFQAQAFDLAMDTPPFREIKGLEMHRLFCDPFVLVLPRSLDLLTMTQLCAQQAHVTYSPSTKFGAQCAGIHQQLSVETPARFHFDSTQSLLRFVQAGYGWAVTSALCLFQAPGLARELVMRPLPQASPREFFMLSHAHEAPLATENVASLVKTVFHQLLEGPWRKLLPLAAASLAGANGQ